MPKITTQSYAVLRKVFELDGWQYISVTGDHIQMKKSGYIRRIVIPKTKEVPVFIILNDLRTARMSREQYFELLDII